MLLMYFARLQASSTTTHHWISLSDYNNHVIVADMLWYTQGKGSGFIVWLYHEFLCSFLWVEPHGKYHTEAACTAFFQHYKLWCKCIGIKLYLAMKLHVEWVTNLKQSTFLCPVKYFILINAYLWPHLLTSRFVMLGKEKIGMHVGV